MKKKTNTLKRKVFLWTFGFLLLGGGLYGAYREWDAFSFLGIPNSPFLKRRLFLKNPHPLQRIFLLISYLFKMPPLTLRKKSLYHISP